MGTCSSAYYLFLTAVLSLVTTRGQPLLQIILQLGNMSTLLTTTLNIYKKKGLIMVAIIPR